MKIIYTRPDGGVSVVVPSPNWSGSIQELAAKDVPHGIAYEIVEDDVIPTDRTFRNAWAQSGKTVVHNMPKAREAWRDKIREKRKAAFEANDIAIRDAQIAKDAVALAVAVAYRDKLRNLPADPRIVAAVTPADLKALTFEELVK